MPKLMVRRSCWAGVAIAGFWGAATLAVAETPRFRFIRSARPEDLPASSASGPQPTRTVALATATVEDVPAGVPAPTAMPDLPENPDSILGQEVTPIDLENALRLAGVQNPQLQIARQRVTEAAAIRMYMAAQILPNLNGGFNFDDHTGVLQQSTGKILKVTRTALYAGAGANAVVAGTVNIPGAQWNLNISNTIFNVLVSRQTVRQREFDSLAARNQVLGRVAVAYVELLRTAGQRAIAFSVRDDAVRIARATAAYAKAGQGRQSDADRAATELARRNTEILQAEAEVLQASARLCRLLNLDPTTRLQPTDGWVVPAPIVPEVVPLNELLALAMLRRPELAAQRAAIEQALLQLRAQRVLPFSPSVLIGFSGGTFGGSSNLPAQTGQTGFGNFANRSDIDTVAYWTLQNLGIGNRAQVNAARARLNISNFEQVAVLNQVRMEVADAYARSRARFAQIAIVEKGVLTGEAGFHEDMKRTENNFGLPIEVLDNLRLWARARDEYLGAIADFNEAQFELYVALGQPPAAALARPVPTSGNVPNDGNVPMNGNVPDKGKAPPNAEGAKNGAANQSAPPTRQGARRRGSRG